MGSYIERLQEPDNNEIVYKVSWSSGTPKPYYDAIKKCGNIVSNKFFADEVDMEIWMITEEYVFDELCKVSAKLEKAGFKHKITVPDIHKHSKYGTKRQNRLRSMYRKKAWKQLDKDFNFEKNKNLKKYWKDIEVLKMLQQLYIDSYYGGFLYQVECPV